MQQSDLEGIARSGAAARAAGGSFHSNPHYASPVQWETVKQLTAWHDIANAWAAGWLDQDAGRARELAALMRLTYW